MTHQGEAEMVFEMDRKGISYRLRSYSRVREFATLLARLEGRWSLGGERVLRVYQSPGW
jgi:hypothetical protein